MRHTNLDMTFPALSRRADEVLTDNCVADILGDGDTREITVFLSHDGKLRCGNEDYADQFTLESKEVIGVALCDLDDPLAPVEVLTRDEAVARFGWKWAERLECVE